MAITLVGQAEATEKFLASNVANHQKRLLASIRKLERNLIDQVSKFKATDGLLEGPKVNLKLSQKLHSNLETLFDEEYGREARRIVKGYKTADKFISKQLRDYDEVGSFTAAERSMLEALKTNTYGTFQQFGVVAQERIVDAVYGTVIGRGSFSELAAEISAALTGQLDKRGRPMSAYADLYAHDALTDYHNQVTLEKNRAAGLTSYLYYGNIMDTTRDFCRARVGNVYTEDEINAWNDQSWSGKSGPPLTSRGGYRCRHSWVPVKPEWTTEEKVPKPKEPPTAVPEKEPKVAPVTVPAVPKKPKLKPAIQKKVDKATGIDKVKPEEGLPIPTKTDTVTRTPEEWQAKTKKWIESQPEYMALPERRAQAIVQAKKDWEKYGRDGEWEEYLVAVKHMKIPDRLKWFDHFTYKNNVGGNIKELYADEARASRILGKLGNKQRNAQLHRQMVDLNDPNINVIYQTQQEYMHERVIKAAKYDMANLVDEKDVWIVPRAGRQGNTVWVSGEAPAAAQISGRKIQMDVYNIDEVNALMERKTLADHSNKVVTSSKDAKKALKEWRATGEEWDVEFMSKYIDGEQAYTWNDALRAGDDLTPYADDLKTMDAFLDQMPKTHAKTYRGLALEGDDLEAFLKKTQAGDVFTEPGYMSTTFTKKTAEGFGSDVVLEVNGKTGSYISKMSFDDAHKLENEVLFPRNSKFMVNSVKQNKKGVWVVKLDEITKETVEEVVEAIPIKPKIGSFSRPRALPVESVDATYDMTVKFGRGKYVTKMKLKSDVAKRLKARLGTLTGETAVDYKYFAEQAELMSPWRPGQAKESIESLLVRNWAATSADTNRLALLLQKAAKIEFDLLDAVDDHFDPQGLKELLEHIANEKIDPAKLARGAQAFVREMYNETQDFLTSQGLDTITLYRGMTVGVDKIPKKFLEGFAKNLDKAKRELKRAEDKLDNVFKKLGIDPEHYKSGGLTKAEAKIMGENTGKIAKVSDPYSEALGRVTYAEQVPVAVMEEIGLQPMSSFSASPGTAHDFAQAGLKTDASAIMAIEVPASRIIATPASGFGCLGETEFVVLGGKTTAPVAMSGRLGILKEYRSVLEGLL